MARVIKAKRKSKVEAKAITAAEERHERARCAIQIATTFLSNYYAAHPPLKVINPIAKLSQSDFPDQEEFNK